MATQNSSVKETICLQIHKAAGDGHFIGIGILCLEMMQRGSLAIGCLRPIFALHQGLLFLIISFVVYNPCCVWTKEDVPLVHALFIGCYISAAGMVLLSVVVVGRWRGCRFGAEESAERGTGRISSMPLHYHLFEGTLCSNEEENSKRESGHYTLPHTSLVSSYPAIPSST